jgi:hypothetical protein
MGVGSEVFEAVRQDRYGVGVELKPSYYRQTLANLATLDHPEYESGTLMSVSELGDLASGTADR